MGLWLWAILSQSSLPRTLGSWLLPLALGLLFLWSAFVVAAVLRAGSSRQRLFLAVLTAALVVRLLGVDYEVEERAYRDEGTYYSHATKINQGQVLRYSFVYPHVMYYLDAFTLWNVSLYPEVWGGVSQRIFGVREDLGRSWLALRILAALISVLAIAAVFRVAQRFAGPVAGAFGAALLIFSPLYNDGSHLIISDVPSASFAAVSWFFAASLLFRERRRDYLLAGIFAGVAAATKYPAGLVAVAIVAAWIRGRLIDRRWTWDLVLAGAVSLATFLIVMPTFFFHPRIAIFGDRGMLFGVRQYADGGWIGVMPSNIPAYYSAELAASFGIPAVVLGIVGLLCYRGRPGLPPALAQGATAEPSSPSRLAQLPGRWALLWLLAFPAAYLALIASMNMVVKRNLYPAVPPLAALLGIGLATGLRRVSAGWPRGRRLTAAVIVLAAFALPAKETLLETAAFTRPSTREAAAAWIRDNLPPGVAILKESYTPRQGLQAYALRQTRFVGRLTMEEIRDPQQDYLLLAKSAYGRFLRDEILTKEHHFEISKRYREILDTFELIAEFPPSDTRRGPWLELYRIPNLPTPQTPELTLPATAAFLPDGSMRPKGSPVIRFTRPGQWALFKTPLATGTYRLQLQGSFKTPPRLRVLTLGGEVLTENLREPFEIQLGKDDKVLVYVFAEEEDRVEGLAVESPAIHRRVTLPKNTSINPQVEAGLDIPRMEGGVPKTREATQGGTQEQNLRETAAANLSNGPGDVRQVARQGELFERTSGVSVAAEIDRGKGEARGVGPAAEGPGFFAVQNRLSYRKKA